MPAVDVAETDKAYEITAELPGLEEKNIEVKLANGVLFIKGEKQEEKEEKQKDYYRRERSFGSFERSFHVPEGVDTDKVAATFKNGILLVTLPKSAEAQKQAKKIEVKGGYQAEFKPLELWFERLTQLKVVQHFAREKAWSLGTHK
jgi:HSP20 family protein